VKVKALHDVTCEWVPGGVAEAGQTYDVPDKQPNGDPLVWSEDFWEPVTSKTVKNKES
jgi:hypothetical protein